MFASLMTSFGGPSAEYEAIQRQLDRLFKLAGLSSAAMRTFPAVNIAAAKDTVEIHVFAPGLDPSAVEVSIDGDLLTIDGERLDDWKETADTHVRTRERFVGAFRRVVSLPDGIDPAKVDASCRDGVLKIVVAMPERVKRHRIRVKTVSGGTRAKGPALASWLQEAARRVASCTGSVMTHLAGKAGHGRSAA